MNFQYITGGKGMKKSLANMMAAGKRCLSLFLIMCMLVTLFPATALAAEVPSGYTTDSHGIMAFKYTGNYFRSFDIKGYFNGAWKKVTYKDLGFTTILKEIDAEAAAANRYDYLYSSGISIHASGNPYVISRSALTKGSSLTVDIDYNYLYDGAVIQMVYTVHNTGSEAVTFSMASGGDIMIGSDDYATITPFNGGFKITSQYASDGYAQLNFWGGAAIAGVTEVDSYWYGYYGKYRNNYFTDLSPKTTLSGVDSGCAWSWQNRTIAGGETQTYSVMLGVGAPGSETVVVPPRYTVSYSTTVGTEPSNPTVEEGESITLPTLNEPGYKFGGWYSYYELTSYVGDGGESYTPTD